MARLQRSLKILCTWFLLCAGYTALPAEAGDPPRKPVLVYTQGPMVGELGDSPATLMARLHERNPLSVNVMLHMDWEYPHRLSESAQAAQAAKIRRLQNKIVSAMKPALDEEFVDMDSSDFPHLALAVNEPQLRSLLNNRWVRAIQEVGPDYEADLGHSTEVIGADKVWWPSENVIRGGQMMELAGEGQTIVIIDSGVYHPTLIDESRIVDGACFNYLNHSCATYNATMNCLCHPGDCLTERFLNNWNPPRTQNNWETRKVLGPGQRWVGIVSACGWSRLIQGSEAGKPPQQDQYHTQQEYYAAYNHGTHVATIAAADSPSLKGVAPKANIIRFQLGHHLVDWQAAGLGWQTWKGGPIVKVGFATWGLNKALARVYELRSTYNIAAVNLSLSSGSFEALCDGGDLFMRDRVNALHGAGIAVVVSTGNRALDPDYEKKIGSPACFSKAIAVGSTSLYLGNYREPDDLMSGFSQHASMVDLLAPGGETPNASKGVLAGVPLSGTGTGTVRMAGTSMAAPHVAGAIAVLKGYKPGASVNELVTALKCTGEPIPHRWGISRNRIDLRSAVKFLENGETHCNMPEIDRSKLRDGGEWLPRHKWF